MDTLRQRNVIYREIILSLEVKKGVDLKVFLIIIGKYFLLCPYQRLHCMH